jgi:hypothetical protein
MDQIAPAAAEEHPLAKFLTGGPDREPERPEPDSGVPLELLDIRPEDIRVEHGVASSVSASSPSKKRDGVAFGREGNVPQTMPAADPTPETSSTLESILAADVVGPIEAQTAEAVGPDISLDSPSSTKRPAAPSPLRPRDLVIPRSVVTAWSLFVLLALALAFIAGLLAGHFLWKVHE